MGHDAQHRGLVSYGSAGRPLRVALVTSSYNFIADGVALTLNRLVGFLQSRGVEVLIFAPVSKTPAFAHQGEIVAVPSAPFPLRSEYRLAFRRELDRDGLAAHRRLRSTPTTRARARHKGRQNH